MERISPCDSVCFWACGSPIVRNPEKCKTTCEKICEAMFAGYRPRDEEELEDYEDKLGLYSLIIISGGLSAYCGSHLASITHDTPPMIGLIILTIASSFLQYFKHIKQIEKYQHQIVYYAPTSLIFLIIGYGIDWLIFKAWQIN